MRLVTRADFDGLVCGALITKFEKIDSYLFVEPKFMQDGLVEIRPDPVPGGAPRGIFEQIGVELPPL